MITSNGCLYNSCGSISGAAIIHVLIDCTFKFGNGGELRLRLMLSLVDSSTRVQSFLLPGRRPSRLAVVGCVVNAHGTPEYFATTRSGMTFLASMETKYHT